MKKFLKKLPVMITFSVITVLFAALMIGLFARPVSYGMTYSGVVSWSEDADDADTIKFNVTIKFKSDRLVEVSQWVDGDKDADTSVSSIIRDGKNVYMVGSGDMTDKEYDAAVKLFNEFKDKFLEQFGGDQGLITVNAYTINFMGNKLVAKGTIAMTVVFAVIELALVAFTALSITYFVAGSKKKTK